MRYTLLVAALVFLGGCQSIPPAMTPDEVASSVNAGQLTDQYVLLWSGDTFRWEKAGWAAPQHADGDIFERLAHLCGWSEQEQGWILDKKFWVGQDIYAFRCATRGQWVTSKPGWSDPTGKTEVYRVEIYTYVYVYNGRVSWWEKSY